MTTIRTKIFIERLNRELDLIGVPTELSERAKAFADIFDLKLSISRAIISGRLMPEPALLEKMAEEFEVNSNWLAGNQDTNKKG